MLRVKILHCQVAAANRRNGVGSRALANRQVLTPGAGHQFVHGILDLLPMIGEGSNDSTKLVKGHRCRLKWIEYHLNAPNAEDQIHPRPGYGRAGWGVLAEHQRHDNATTVGVESRSLDDHNERNAVLLAALVATDIKLRHEGQSVECSSANDPHLLSNSFQASALALAQSR